MCSSFPSVCKTTMTLVACSRSERHYIGNADRNVTVVLRGLNPEESDARRLTV